MKVFSALLVGILVCITSFAQKSGPTPTAPKIIGRWAFDHFNFPGWLATLPEKDKTAATISAKNTVISFGTDNKYTTVQPGGPRETNFKATYRLINNNNKFICRKDTITIVLANDKQLILSKNEDYPQAVFKRIP